MKKELRVNSTYYHGVVVEKYYCSLLPALDLSKNRQAYSLIFGNWVPSYLTMAHLEKLLIDSLLPHLILDGLLIFKVTVPTGLVKSKRALSTRQILRPLEMYKKFFK